MASFRWLDEIRRSRLTKNLVGNSPSIDGNPDPKKRYFFRLTKKSEDLIGSVIFNKCDLKNYVFKIA
jgi:hypothetical protein